MLPSRVGNGDYNFVDKDQAKDSSYRTMTVTLNETQSRKAAPNENRTDVNTNKILLMLYIHHAKTQLNTDYKNSVCLFITTAATIV